MLAVGKLLQQRPELAVACPDVIERELGLHELLSPRHHGLFAGPPSTPESPEDADGDQR